MSKPKLKISAWKAAEDIKSGLSDSDTMQKYMLSPKGLVNLYKKLLEVGIVDQEDMDRRMNAVETTVELEIDKYPFEIAKGLRPHLGDHQSPLRPGSEPAPDAGIRGPG